MARRRTMDYRGQLTGLTPTLPTGNLFLPTNTARVSPRLNHRSLHPPSPHYNHSFPPPLLPSPQTAPPPHTHCAAARPVAKKRTALSPAPPSPHPSPPPLSAQLRDLEVQAAEKRTALSCSEAHNQESKGRLETLDEVRGWEVCGGGESLGKCTALSCSDALLHQDITA